MRLVNRTAVTLVGAEPYLEWTRTRDADFATGHLTVAHTKSYGFAVLLPELAQEEDLIEWVEDNFSWLFEFQLSQWTHDESAWPQTRDLKTFRNWFRIDIHSTVIDAGDDEIEGEEL